jgi:D-arabinose 5-phosphate isomerase GutQ
MNSKENSEALEAFVNITKEEIDEFFYFLKTEDYTRAAKLILDSEKAGGRIHITGIGKPSHVAEYMASLLSSTGTPTYYLHGTEAVHGSCGQLVPGDVVICISNSGETSELKATVNAIKDNGCKVISVSGNSHSWLAREGDAFLFAGVTQEGGPLNRAPRASILAELLTLQGLSVVLQTSKELTPREYVKWHPGGSLGKLREKEVTIKEESTC